MQVEHRLRRLTLVSDCHSTRLCGTGALQSAPPWLASAIFASRQVNWYSEVGKQIPDVEHVRSAPGVGFKGTPQRMPVRLRRTECCRWVIAERMPSSDMQRFYTVPRRLFRASGSVRAVGGLWCRGAGDAFVARCIQPIQMAGTQHADSLASRPRGLAASRCYGTSYPTRLRVKSPTGVSKFTDLMPQMPLTKPFPQARQKQHPARNTRTELCANQETLDSST